MYHIIDVIPSYLSEFTYYAYSTMATLQLYNFIVVVISF